MPIEVSTCPKCGAMITPQLARCRQCKTYLHGTRAEGFLLETILPARFARSPGTGIVLLSLVAYYVAMVILSGIESIAGFTGYNLTRLGAAQGALILAGEVWRLVTANFAHHDLIHLAFNLYALTILGPLVEDAFDRKKMLLLFVATGVVSMIASQTWHSVIQGEMFVSVVGASGAICGLLGATWYTAWRMGPPGRDVARVMRNWAFFLVLWGFVGNVDSAAHLGGGLAGAAVAAVMPRGLTKSVTTQKLLSLAVGGMFLAILACIAIMLDDIRRYGARLEADAGGRSMMFFGSRRGTDWSMSSQERFRSECDKAATTGRSDPEAIDLCERHLRAIPWDPNAYFNIASMLEASGFHDRAARLRSVGTRIAKKQWRS